MAHRARWTCLCLLLAALSTAAADWRAELPAARRLGVGEFTWFGLRLYTAQLWTAGPVHDWNQPFALELLYHRSLSKGTLVQATLEEMRRLNGGSITSQHRTAWTHAIEQAFVDVRPGMRITGLYLPGRTSTNACSIAWAHAVCWCGVILRALRRCISLRLACTKVSLDSDRW